MAFCLFHYTPAKALAEQLTSPIVFDIGITKYRPSGEYYQGEPICVRVGIRGRFVKGGASNIPVAIGTPTRPWYDNVKLYFTKIRI